MKQHCLVAARVGLLPRGRPGDNTRWAVTSSAKHSPPAPDTDKQSRMATATGPPQCASSKLTKQVQVKLGNPNTTGTALRTSNPEAQLRLGLKGQPKWAEGVVGAPGEASQGH